MLKKFAGSILIVAIVFLAAFAIRSLSNLSTQAPRHISTEVITPQDNILLGKKIDINTASAEVFETLPGIGPSLSRRIITYREKYGPFKRLNDLQKVKGIGAKKFEKIYSLVSVD